MNLSEIPSLFAAGRKTGAFHRGTATSPWTPPPREEEAAWREEAGADRSPTGCDVFWNRQTQPNPICEPWCWNMNPNIYPINEPNVGKYTSTMEHMGTTKTMINMISIDITL